MSDETEGPPPLSAQVHAFFEDHATTGEPTQAELGQALLRLHGSTRPAALMVGGRRFLPPEVLAVAAVLVLSVGGAFIGWRVRTANAQTEALSQAKVAWVKGDLDAASAAFEACSTPDCARLAAAVKRAKQQSADLEGLDEAEAGSLLALDRELSGGERSVISERLEKKPQPVESDRDFAEKQLEVLQQAGVPRHIASMAVALFIRAATATSPDQARFLFAHVVKQVPDSELARAAQKKLAALEGAPVIPAPSVASPEPLTPELEALVERAKAAKKERRHDEAIRVLQQCLASAPDQPECVVLLASTFAMRGMETESGADNAQARTLYKRFLEVAPPTDKRIPRVEEILRDTGSAVVGEQLGEDAFHRGYVLKGTDPEGARRAFAEALSLSEPGSATAAKAKAQLEALGGQPSGTAPASAWAHEAHDLYLRGYQVRESNPAVARALFRQVILLAPDSIDAEKARSRIEALPPAEEPASGEEVIVLQVNERRVLVFPELARVALGDADIADVATRGNNQLELTGMSVGTTTLMVWTASGQRVSRVITVIPRAGKHPRQGRLKIASYPTQANVIIDGKATGRRTPVLPTEPIELPAGRHTIEFELNGKRSARQTIDVAEGDNPVVKGEIPQ